MQDLRRNYTFGSLVKEMMPDRPLALFERWWEELQSAEIPEWFERNAMTLGTQNENGVSSRVVLLKGLDSGFLFFTNYDSAKGRQIATNPNVSLNFFWPMFERQVRVEGKAEFVEGEISDQYFSSRPRASQLGAIASPQSVVVADENALQEAMNTLEAKFSGQSIPRPSHWGGYRVVPNSIEYWQGRPSRLHDRFKYSLRNETWVLERLAP
jgi:pyridoxamine 5'-phosphate oxidase